MEELWGSRALERPTQRQTHVYQRAKCGNSARDSKVTEPQPTLYQTAMYRGSLNGQAKTKTNAPHVAAAIPTNKADLALSVGAPRRITTPSRTIGGIDKGIILRPH